MKKEIKINFKLLAYKVINVIFYLFVCGLLWIAIFNPALSRFVSIEEIYVPDVRGEYESDALTILHKSGFSVKIEYIPYDKEVEPYTVFSMFPRAYTKVKKNRVIEIVVYKDKEKIKIPNYTGLDIRDTRSKIKRDGFLIKDQNTISACKKTLRNLIKNQLIAGND